MTTRAIKSADDLTLFKTYLDGRRLPFTVTVEDGVRLGYFSQFSELDGAESITAVLEGLFTEIHEVQAELAQIDAIHGEDQVEFLANFQMAIVNKTGPILREVDQFDLARPAVGHGLRSGGPCGDPGFPRNPLGPPRRPA